VVVLQVLRRIACQGVQVGDAVFGVPLQNGAYLLLLVADRSEMGDGVAGCRLFEAHDEIVGALARGAARAVGDGDERGPQRFEFADGLVELFRRLVGLGREELEAERGAMSGKDVLNVHGLLGRRACGARQLSACRDWCVYYGPKLPSCQISVQPPIGSYRGISRNAWVCPLRLPTPSICPASWMALAYSST